MFETIKKYFREKKLKASVKPDERLYVITHDKLSPTYAAVQGAHGVAQWLIEHPDQKWANRYLIFLKGDLRYAQKCLEGQDYSIFKEPDLNDCVTSVVTLATPENIVFLRSLKLLN